MCIFLLSVFCTIISSGQGSESTAVFNPDFEAKDDTYNHFVNKVHFSSEFENIPASNTNVDTGPLHSHCQNLKQRKKIDGNSRENDSKYVFRKKFPIKSNKEKNYNREKLSRRQIENEDSFAVQKLLKRLNNFNVHKTRSIKSFHNYEYIEGDKDFDVYEDENQDYDSDSDSKLIRINSGLNKSGKAVGETSSSSSTVSYKDDKEMYYDYTEKLDVGKNVKVVEEDDKKEAKRNNKFQNSLKDSGNAYVNEENKVKSNTELVESIIESSSSSADAISSPGEMKQSNDDGQDFADYNDETVGDEESETEDADRLMESVSSLKGAKHVTTESSEYSKIDVANEEHPEKMNVQDGFNEESSTIIEEEVDMGDDVESIDNITSRTSDMDVALGGPVTLSHPTMLHKTYQSANLVKSAEENILKKTTLNVVSSLVGKMENIENKHSVPEESFFTAPANGNVMKKCWKQSKSKTSTDSREIETTTIPVYILLKNHKFLKVKNVGHLPKKFRILYECEPRMVVDYYDRKTTEDISPVQDPNRKRIKTPRKCFPCTTNALSEDALFAATEENPTTLSGSQVHVHYSHRVNRMKGSKQVRHDRTGNMTDNAENLSENVKFNKKRFSSDKGRKKDEKQNFVHADKTTSLKNNNVVKLMDKIKTEKANKLSPDLKKSVAHNKKITNYVNTKLTNIKSRKGRNKNADMESSDLLNQVMDIVDAKYKYKKEKTMNHQNRNIKRRVQKSSKLITHKIA